MGNITLKSLLAVDSHVINPFSIHTDSNSVTLSLRRPKRDLATNWEPSL